jgi:hypothetical protein
MSGPHERRLDVAPQTGVPAPGYEHVKRVSLQEQE